MNWKEKLEAYLMDSFGCGLPKDAVLNYQFGEQDEDILMYAVEEKKSLEDIIKILDWIIEGKPERTTPGALRGYVDETRAASAAIGAFMKGWMFNDEMIAYGLDMDIDTREQYNRWLSYIAMVSKTSVEAIRDYGREILAGDVRNLQE